jgi:predicted enzyme related to lactoylglutathione lyase
MRGGLHLNVPPEKEFRPMSEHAAPVTGAIAWHDLTVDDAEGLRDFYASVVGWTPSPVQMGDYADYGMAASDGSAVAGVCHARGVNEGIPPQWLLYIVVENLDASLAECDLLGGSLLHGPRDMHGSKFAVIRDPAGAVAGLYETAPVAA